MEKFKLACDDWKILTSFEKEEQMVAALRLRLKGPVKEFMELHRDLPAKIRGKSRKWARDLPLESLEASHEPSSLIHSRGMAQPYDGAQ